jgi:hypothetical protein
MGTLIDRMRQKQQRVKTPERWLPEMPEPKEASESRDEAKESPAHDPPLRCEVCDELCFAVLLTNVYETMCCRTCAGYLLARAARFGG